MDQSLSPPEELLPPINAPQHDLLHSRIYEIFRKYDHDHDNTMSSYEMHAALTSMGVTISAQDALSLWEKYDVDGNKKLDFVEFYKLFEEAVVLEQVKREDSVRKSKVRPEFSDSDSEPEIDDGNISLDSSHRSIDEFTMFTLDDKSEIYGNYGMTNSMYNPNSSVGSLPSLGGITHDVSDAFAQKFGNGQQVTIDDTTLNEYASKSGKHIFNDPDLESINPSNAREMSIKLKKFESENPYVYKTSSVIPDSVTKDPDWERMAGVIKKRELTVAFETMNHLRTPAQVNLIRTWLETHWEMARHLGTRRMIALAKCVQYFEASENVSIITEGERGYTFYIIIEGTVRVVVKKYGVVSKLSKGDFFGERALTSQKYECRQASVISESSPCKLLVLHKSDYDQIIRKHHETLRTESYKVLKNVPLFNHWSRSRLERVCSMLERKELPGGKQIFRQGDLPDFIYFIVDGTVEVIKEITVSMKNRWPKPGGGSEEIVRKFVNKFKILDIGAGKYFGEIAIVNNTCRAATCKTTEPTTLLALDKFEFLNLLNKGHAMQNIYSQTQGYPSDEDILHLFTALKVQKKQSDNIKKGRKGGKQVRQVSNHNADASLPSNYDARRNSVMISATAEDVVDSSGRRKRIPKKKGTIGAANVGTDKQIEEEIMLKKEQEKKMEEAKKEQTRNKSRARTMLTKKAGSMDDAAQSALEELKKMAGDAAALFDSDASNKSKKKEKVHKQMIKLSASGDITTADNEIKQSGGGNSRKGSVFDAVKINPANKTYLKKQQQLRRTSLILSQNARKKAKAYTSKTYKWGDDLVQKSPQELHDHWQGNVSLLRMAKNNNKSSNSGSGVTIKKRRKSSLFSPKATQRTIKSTHG